MSQERIVFSQLLDWIPKYEFDKCVKKYQGNLRVKTFSCYNQFLTLAFAQLTARESLRDIETCLRVFHPKFRPPDLDKAAVGKESASDPYFTGLSFRWFLKTSSGHKEKRMILFRGKNNLKGAPYATSPLTLNPGWSHKY